jgi:hypothetical protein
MKKLIPLVIIPFFVSGCLSRGPDVGQPQAVRLVQDPRSAIESILPAGWIINNVTENTHPFYREAGNGTAYDLAVEGKDYSKQQCEAIVWIMPADYSDTARKGKLEDDVHGQQTSTPEMIIEAMDGKVFLWPGGTSPRAWATMEDDLKRVLLVSP